METQKLPAKMMLSKECLIKTKIKETNLLDKMLNHKAFPNQEKLNSKVNILKVETLLLGLDNILDNILENVDTVAEMTLETVVDVEMTETETLDNNVKIEEILILKLSLKSTLLELLEILVKRILKSFSLSSERSKTSQ